MQFWAADMHPAYKKPAYLDPILLLQQILESVTLTTKSSQKQNCDMTGFPPRKPGGVISSFTILMRSLDPVSVFGGVGETVNSKDVLVQHLLEWIPSTTKAPLRPLAPESLFRAGFIRTTYMNIFQNRIQMCLNVNTFEKLAERNKCKVFTKVFKNIVNEQKSDAPTAKGPETQNTDATGSRPKAPVDIRATVAT